MNFDNRQRRKYDVWPLMVKDAFAALRNPVFKIGAGGVGWIRDILE